MYHCVCLRRVGRSWYKDLTVSVLELSVIVLIAVIIVIHCPTGPTAWNSVQYDIRRIVDTNSFQHHLQFHFFHHYFLNIGLLYVMFYVKSVIRNCSVNIVIGVQ